MRAVLIALAVIIGVTGQAGPHGGELQVLFVRLVAAGAGQILVADIGVQGNARLGGAHLRGGAGVADKRFDRADHVLGRFFPAQFLQNFLDLAWLGNLGMAAHTVAAHGKSLGLGFMTTGANLLSGCFDPIRLDLFGSFGCRRMTRGAAHIRHSMRGRGPVVPNFQIAIRKRSVQRRQISGCVSSNVRLTRHRGGSVQRGL